MVRFSKLLKTMPDFEFLSNENKKEILRNFMSVYMDGYKNLNEEDKKAAEAKVFKFYGIKVTTTKNLIDSAVGSLKTEIDDLKNVISISRNESSSARKKIAEKIDGNRLEGWEAKISALKDSIEDGRVENEATIKKLSNEIKKNKPKDWESKLDSLAEMLADSKTESKRQQESINSRINEVGNKFIDLAPVTDGLKVALNENRVSMTKALEGLSEELSNKSPNKWVFKVERDYRDLITEITAKAE